MNVIFSRNCGLAISLPRILSKRFVASAVKEESKKDDLDITSLEEETALPVTDVGLSEEEIEQKRNKSRLNVGDRNVLNNIVPRNEVIHRFQETVKYKRRMVGRYGMQASDAPIGIAWPTKQEVEDAKEYESVLYPETIQQMWEKIAKKNVEEAKAIRARDETIAQNLMKLDKWSADLKAKIAKKEAEALAARERKERLMEEVRRHFGFMISPKDERFKAMLEQKDKAEKKLRKQARKQARDQKMIAMLAERSAAVPKKEDTENSKDSENVQ